MTIIDKIIKGDIAPKNTNVLWLNTLDNIIYVFSNGWIKTSTGAAASVYTGTEAERLAIEEPFNGLEFHQVDENGKVTRYLYDLNAWTIVIDPSDYIIRADQDHTRAEADHTAAASDHTNATQDHSLAVVDHQNAVDDHAQYLVDHESIAHKANVDGYYAQMTVGAAENLVGDSEETYTFTTQMTGGEAEFGSGAGQLTKVQGNGLAWNQFVQNGDFSDGTTGWTGFGGTLSFANNVLKYTAGSAVTSASRLQTNSVTIGGHKYLIGGYFTTPRNQSIRIGNEKSNLSIYIKANTRTKAAVIYEAVNNGTTIRYYINSNGTTVENDEYLFEKMQSIDLSLIYGFGNEPATVADAEARLAALVGEKPYYQHNAGELFGTKVLHLISYGQNLLNPANGQARLAPYSYESIVNKYGIAAKAGVTLGTITFTPDATGVAETITPDSNGQFTISGAGTLNVAVSAGSLADVYVWAVYDGAKDGIENFVPFQQDAVEIKVSEIYGKLNGAGEYVKVFADNVMRGAGSAHDVIDLQSMTADVNCAGVDLGSLSWSKRPDLADGRFSTTGISNYKRVLGSNCSLCAKYISLASSAAGRGYADMDKTFFFYAGEDPSSVAYITNTAYADSTEEQFKTAMSGVLLWYELKTPLQYTDLKLSSDGETFRELPTSIVVDNWGVWQQKPSEGITPVTGHDFEGIAATISTILPMDAVEILKSVQDNGIMTSEQRAQLTSILTALQTAGIIGSFTIAETPTDKVFPITITAPVEPESEP